MKPSVRFLPTMLVILLVGVPVNAQEPGLTETVVKPMGDLPAGAGSVCVSASGDSLAYVLSKPEGSVVVRDNVAGPAFSAVAEPLFCPQGKKLAYKGVTDGRTCVVVDSKSGPRTFEKVGPLVFSPNSMVAYLAYEGNDTFIVQGERVIQAPAGSTQEQLSADGTRYAFVIRSNVTVSLVIDGVRDSTNYSSVSDLTFTPDSRHVVFISQHSPLVSSVFISVNDWRAPTYAFHYDNQVSDRYGYIQAFAISPDSRSFAFWATVAKVDQHPVLVRGKTETLVPSNATRSQAPVFSPNGSRMIVFMDGNPGTIVVCDGKPQPVREQVGKPVFSANSKRYAYTARRDRQWHLVVDGKASEVLYNSIDSILFSPDASHLAAVVKRNKQTLVLYDGKELGPYDSVDGLGYSADSRHFFFRAKSAQKHMIVVNGVSGPAHDALHIPDTCFTDRTSGKPFAGIAGIYPGTMRYITVDDGAAQLVTLDWPKPTKPSSSSAKGSSTP